MTHDDRPVLVTGATGKQGGAVARALLGSGAAVHAFVRDPGAERAVALAGLGATLVAGDLDDVESVKAAATGVRGVFSMQTPDFADLMGDAEVRQGRNLVEGARSAGVEQIVHTSVSGAATVGPIDPQRWDAFQPHYWQSKAAVEDAVRAAGFPHATILRPAIFMENFVRPSVYFANWTEDRLLVAYDADIVQPFVAVDDIGAAAAAAFAEPERFAGVELELAGDLLTFREAAAIVSDALGVRIDPPSTTAEQAIEQGLIPELARAEAFMSEHVLPARPEFARALALTTTSFRAWAATVLR